MDHVEPAGRRSLVSATVAVCFAVAVLEGFDIQALGVAAPHLVPELGLAPSQIGAIFSIGNVGLVAGSLCGGWAADRWGRKAVLLAATLTFAMFTLAVAGVHSFEALFAARLLAGLGFGAALPNMMALAAEVSPRERRATTAAMMFCGLPMGGGTVALLTQVLPPGWDWRALFVIGGTLPLVVAGFIALRLVDTYHGTAPHARIDQTPVVHALFGDGRASPTLLLWLAFFPTLLALYLILNWLPLLVANRGFARELAPQAAIAFNYGGVAGALLLGQLTDRFGRRWPLFFAYLGLLTAFVALAWAQGFRSVLAASAAAGFCLLGANYALYGIAPAHYPTAMRGTGSGAAIGIGRIGSVLGPWLAGAWIAQGSTAGSVLLYMVPAAVVAGIAVFALSFHQAPH